MLVRVHYSGQRKNFNAEDLRRDPPGREVRTEMGSSDCVRHGSTSSGAIFDPGLLSFYAFERKGGVRRAGARESGLSGGERFGSFTEIHLRAGLD